MFNRLMLRLLWKRLPSCNLEVCGRKPPLVKSGCGKVLVGIQISLLDSL